VSFKGIRIGVLEGGLSSERSVSLRSGRAIKQALRSAGIRPVSVDPGRRARFRKLLARLDLAFIALHGAGGEDGTIQNLLERRGIAYIGSDAAGCRNSFDKRVSKRLFSSHGIPTPAAVIVNRRNWRRKAARFGPPFFVKPLREGSSVGVFLVEDLRRAAARIRAALARYGELLLERRIEGREVTVGILGRRALPVVELRPRRAFYDYVAKYTKGMCRYLVPAPLAAPAARRIQRVALAAHRRLGLRDFSRVDLMLDRRGRPYVLEVNSIPGFTERSLLPKAARAAGIGFTELCLELLTAAEGRRRKMKERRNGG
jgi:D-alanine-D-alanine ligase